MAKKQPVKLIKPASKPIVQAKKATPVKKSVPLKKAVPVKAAAKGKPVASAKKVVPAKKTAVAPAKKAVKSAGKVNAVVKPTAAKTTNTTKAPQKLVSKKIEVVVKKSNISEKRKQRLNNLPKQRLRQQFL